MLRLPEHCIDGFEKNTFAVCPLKLKIQVVIMGKNNLSKEAMIIGLFKKPFLTPSQLTSKKGSYLHAICYSAKKDAYQFSCKFFHGFD